MLNEIFLWGQQIPAQVASRDCKTNKQTKIFNGENQECYTSRKVPPVCSNMDRESKTGMSTKYEKFPKPLMHKQQKLGQTLMEDMSCKSRSVSMGLQDNAFQYHPLLII